MRNGRVKLSVLRTTAVRCAPTQLFLPTQHLVMRPFYENLGIFGQQNMSGLSLGI